MAKKKKKRRLKKQVKLGLIVILIVVIVFIIGLFLSNSNDSEISKETPETEPTNKVSFVAVGDIIAHDSVNQNAYDTGTETYNYDSMFSEVQNQISSADIAFANQETISTSSSGITGYPSFNAPFSLVDSISNSGFDIVSIANNHAVDVSSTAPSETKQYYNENYPNIAVSGTNDSCNAIDYQEFEVNGISFTFNSYTYGVNNEGNVSDCNVNVIGDDNYDKSIKDLTSTGDVNIVSLHFGEEDVTEISQEERDTVQNLLDSGVEIILGSHPHVVKPIEVTTNSQGNDAIVAYSLGNFLSTQLEDTERIGGMLSFDITKGDKITIDNVVFTPTYQYYTWDDPTEEDLNSRKNVKVVYLPNVTDLVSEDYYLELKALIENVIDSQYLSYLPTEAYSDITYLDNESLNLQTVVNKHYCLNSDYEPDDLVVPNVELSTRTSDDVHYVSKVVEDDLVDMFNAAKDSGYELVFTSGYRPYSTQESLYNSYVSSDGVEAADTYSARPGCSEHQTGIAFDISEVIIDNESVDAFNGTDAAKWIKDNSYKYGFIVRYPEDKTGITQYEYESWHLRYVGKEAASKMHDNNWTLEEYFYMKSKS